MAKRKSYDDKFRASAVVMLAAAGYPANKFKLAEVAKHLGIPSRSLRRWFIGENGAPPDKVVTQEKKALADRLEELAHKLVDVAFKIADDSGDEKTIQQVVTSLGIVVDKGQLLRGGATERLDIDDSKARDARSKLDSALARLAERNRPEGDSQQPDG